MQFFTIVIYDNLECGPLIPHTDYNKALEDAQETITCKQEKPSREAITTLSETGSYFSPSDTWAVHIISSD